MVYLKRLTGSEAVRCGAGGIVAFSLAYGLATIAGHVDRIARSRIEARISVRTEEGSSKRLAVDRWINICSDFYQGILDRISLLTNIFLSALAFLLWNVGASLIFYAVIGPLLY